MAPGNLSTMSTALISVFALETLSAPVAKAFPSQEESISTLREPLGTAHAWQKIKGSSMPHLLKSAYRLSLTLISAATLSATLAQAASPPLGLKCLVAAYPHRFKIGDDQNSVVWNDGTRMIYNDGGVRNPAQQFENADLRDMMQIAYPRGTDDWLPRSPWFDPGRNRNEAFFKKMYGASARDVSAHLVTVAWSPDPRVKVPFTSVNGASRQLQAVADELAQLSNQDRTLEKYLLSPLGGTFNWRVIVGTTKLSVHSFGAAIDINTKYSDYWHNTPGQPVYRNKIPLSIVNVFEKHGFIWGGKWAHYDTMHFEYRPELLLPGCF